MLAVNDYNKDSEFPQVQAVNDYNKDSEFPQVLAVNDYNKDSEFPQVQAVNDYNKDSEFPQVLAVNDYNKDSEFPQVQAVNDYNKDSQVAQVKAAVTVVRRLYRILKVHVAHSCQPLLGVNHSPVFMNLYLPVCPHCLLTPFLSCQYLFRPPASLCICLPKIVLFFQLQFVLTVF